MRTELKLRGHNTNSYIIIFVFLKYKYAQRICFFGKHDKNKVMQMRTEFQSYEAVIQIHT